MQLDEFLYNLHFNIDAVRPVDVTVDWDDAPLPFKLYQGLPATGLPSEITLDLKTTGSSARSDVKIQDIGDFFWYSYGLTQLCHTILPLVDGEERLNVVQMLRRYVPSGGALYPSELYAYLKVDGFTPGIYHYDVAHHCLIRLREGNFDDYLERALGHRCTLSPCFAVLFISTMFWKNFYKYNNFAYRLQGLDAGALIGQLLEVCEQVGYHASVYFQFIDRAVNHLLGLYEEEESVYAVIPLSLAKSNLPGEHTGLHTDDDVESAGTLCSELPALQHKYDLKSRNISGYPMLIQINEKSMFDSTRAFTQIPKLRSGNSISAGSTVPLPNVEVPSYTFTDACRRRFSPGLDFVSGGVTLEQISALLRETNASSAYVNDLASDIEETGSRVAIAACVHGIEGLIDGAYIYDASSHVLRLLCEGDHRMQLQLGTSMPTVNLFQVPICFHLVGPREIYLKTFGYRGYRIQQMEVGMLLQRLLLRTAALELGGHPLLGYDEGVCDSIYHFGKQGQTCLIQVPVGRYRKTARFEGALFG